MSLFRREKRPEPATVTCLGCGARGYLDPPAISPGIWKVRVETVETSPSETYALCLRVTCQRCGWTTSRPTFAQVKGIS